MKKRVFIGVLAALMLFAFVACDSQATYSDKTLVRLGVEKVSDKDYLVGQEFDPSTITVTAYFRDGSTAIADPAKDLYFDYNFSTPGNKTVSISYQNVGVITGVPNTATYKVDVYKPSKLIATGTPSVTQYYQNSGTSNVVTLENTGVNVVAQYDGNKTMPLTSEEFALTVSSATIGEASVTANYLADKTVRNVTDIKVKVVADELDPESFEIALATGKETPVVNQKYTAGDYVVSAKMMSGKDVSETELKSAGTLTVKLVNPGEEQTRYVSGSRIEATYLPTGGIKYTDTISFGINVAPANDYPVEATIAWKDNTAPTLKKGEAISEDSITVTYKWKSSDYTYSAGTAPVVSYNVIPETVQEEAGASQSVWIEFPAYPDVKVTNNGQLSFTVAK